MASTKISALTALSTLLGTHQFGMNAAGLSRRATVDQVAAYARNNSSTVKWARDYPGNDLGEKVNAAVAAIGIGNPGRILIDADAGDTVTTPIVGGYFQAIELVGPNIITLNESISIGHFHGEGSGDENAINRLTQGNGRNLAKLLIIIASRGTCRGFLLDGNKANNSSGGVGIWSDLRIFMENLRVVNCKSHGCLISSRTGSIASSTVAKTAAFYSNDGSGIRIENAFDFAASGYSEFGDNAQHGIDLYNAAGARIIGCDIASNQEAGIKAHGTSGVGQFGSGLLIIEGNQFGQNYKNDILITGHDGSGYTSFANTINGNSFWGGGLRADQVYSAIKLDNSKENVIAGNLFYSTPGTEYKNLIEETTTGQAGGNVIGANQWSGAIGGPEAALIVSSATVKHAGLDTISKYPELSVENLGIRGDDFFLGGEDGDNDITQFIRNSASSVGGIEARLLGLAKSGVGLKLALDESGNLGLAGNLGVLGTLGVTGKMTGGGGIAISLSTYADNAAALAGGLVAGDFYKTATGELRIVV